MKATQRAQLVPFKTHSGSVETNSEVELLVDFTSFCLLSLRCVKFTIA